MFFSYFYIPKFFLLLLLSSVPVQSAPSNLINAVINAAEANVQVSIQPSYYWGYANCDPATQIPDHTPLTQNTPSTFLVTKGDDGEPLGSVSVKLTFAHPTQNQHLPTGAKAVAAYLTLPGCTDLDPSCTVKVADTNGFTGCFSPPTGAWWDRGWVRFEH